MFGVVPAPYLGRLPTSDQVYVPSFQQNNPTFVVSDDYQSYSYHAVISHIPVQRTHHQTASYAYRTNQMVKHAFEDGHMTLPQLTLYTDRMYNMSDKQAFQYAQQHLNFK